ncbi:hypothetical protein CDO73_07130 [Saccharibacillus sp. O23]|uniref:metallophosphoesterase n=1 Tax=Saccharibacillus sp. O23 TaxID=2009338 RepID=UPI000B4E252A|nr:metallophosphoesterase [Saccharibacillus sp. O23]OWR31491.1 hypothetical protein CDO73_07130 [Saccharibacillus sp. O23]
MRIVHISDFHLSKNDVFNTKNVIMKALVKDLLVYHEQKKIDLICFTGDAIDKGGQSFGNAEQAFDTFKDLVIQPLLSELNLETKQFVFVPGNHDINRNADSQIVESGLIKELHDVNSVMNFMNSENNEGTKRLNEFKRFEREFHNYNLDHITNYQSNYILEACNKKIGITCFNTSWRCYDNQDDGKILMGVQQIYNSNAILEDCDIKIALMHHQFTALQDFDIESCEALMQKEYDIILSGHVHTGSHSQRITVVGEAFSCVAAGNMSSNIWNESKKYVNGYAVIDYFDDEKRIDVYSREFSDTRNEFIENSKNTQKNGKAEYYLNSSNSKSKKKQDMSLTKLHLLDTPVSLENTDSNSSLAEGYIIDKEKTSIELHNDESDYVFFNSSKFYNNLSSIFRQTEQLDVLSKINNYVLMIDRLLYVEPQVLQIKKLIEEFETNQFLNNLNVSSIFELLEIWYGVIFNLINPKENINQNTLQKDKIIHFIDLVSSQFEKNACNERVNYLLNKSKNTFANIKSQNDVWISYENKDTVFQEIIMNFTVPVIIFYEEIKLKLSNQKIGSNMLYENYNLLELIKSEYYDQKFTEYRRDSEYQNVIDALKANKIVLLRGANEVGKTHIISCVLKKIKLNNTCNTLVYSFKYSNNFTEFTKAIVQQCNDYMVNKLSISSIESYINRNFENDFDDVNRPSKFEVLKRYFAEAVKRLVTETGTVIIIIDSIEMLQDQKNIINELLNLCPEECRILLSTSDNEDSYSYDHKIIVNDLSREDIPVITGIKEEDELEKNLNVLFFEKTKGKVKSINRLLLALDKSDGKSKEIVIEEFEYQFSEVPIYQELAEYDSSNEVFEEILLMLSISKGIQALHIEQIQSFIRHRGKLHRLPHINRELKKIQNYISEIRFDRITLVDNQFAEYILKKHFSRIDVEEFINYLFEWMATDKTTSIDFTSEFFRKMKNHSIIPENNFNKGIDIFLKSANDARLFSVGFDLYSQSEQEPFNDLSLKLIEKAAFNKYTEALSFLGFIYSLGKGVGKDTRKALDFLEKAVELEDSKAMLVLGCMFLDGDEVDEDLVKGELLLRKAAEFENQAAKLELAIRLLLGKTIPSDIPTSDKIFQELLEMENEWALYIMGTRYFQGEAVEKNIEYGKNLLERSIKKGNRVAKINLAEFLITENKDPELIKQGENHLQELMNEGYDNALMLYYNLLKHGKGIDKNIPKSLEILDEARKSKSKKADLEYVRLLFEGVYIPNDILEAQKILDDLVSSDFCAAMAYKADLLIDGKYYTQNTELGLALLTKAASTEEIKYGNLLALRYIQGYNVPQDIEKGMEIFESLIKKGASSSKYLYARSIISLKQLNKNQILVKKAISLLKEATFYGHVKAFTFLGELYVEGEFVEKNIIKGEELLKKAAESLDPEALRELGHYYIIGDEIPKDIKKAETLLVQASELGDLIAKTILANNILLGESSLYDTDQAVEMLETAAEKETNAQRILGSYLLNGVFMKQDVERGKNLLKIAMNEGDASAKLKLARILLDGKIVKGKIEEGEKLLIELVEEKDEEAEIEFAERLFNGKGIGKNVAKAISYLESISEKNLDAKHRYACKLLLGSHGVVKNVFKGEKLLRESLEKGQADSKRVLAELVIKGIIKSETITSAIKILEECVENHDPIAMNSLGNIYLEGSEVEKDIDKATTYFEMLLKEKNQALKVDYAMRLLEGREINSDFKKAISILEECSLKGNLNAKYELALIYIQGSYNQAHLESMGIEMILQLYHNGYAEAELFYAKNILYGNYFDEDEEIAIEIFEKLCEDDYKKAIISYAEILINGYYVPKNVFKAEKLLKQLGKIDNDQSSYLLGKFYLEQKGARKQVKNGKSYLQKASSQNLPIAMLEYGIMLKKGLRFNKDERKGNQLIETAIRKVNVQGLQNLGIASYNLKEYELATRLFVNAYEKGVESAGVSLAYLLRRNEIQGDCLYNNIFSLLQSSLLSGSDTAIINLALSLAENQNNEEDWIKADLIVQSLGYCYEAVDWWLGVLNSHNDIEGKLVLGWLAKHKKIEKHHFINVEEFLTEASSKWEFASWLLDR